MEGDGSFPGISSSFHGSNDAFHGSSSGIFHGVVVEASMKMVEAAMVVAAEASTKIIVEGASFHGRGNVP